MLRDVPPDRLACEAEDRRVRLSQIVNAGVRVRVRNPVRPGAEWEGVIFGLADFPTLLLRTEDGQTRVLPQHFAVDVIEDEEAADAPSS